MQRPHRQHAAAIDGLTRGLADMAMDAMLEADPALESRYGGAARRVWRAEIGSRLAHLVQALACGRPGVYGSHVAWSADALRAREIPEPDIRAHMAALAATLAAELPEDAAGALAPYHAAATEALDAASRHREGLLDRTGGDSTLARLYLLHLLQRDQDKAFGVAMDALRGGLALGAVHERVIVPALGEVGRMWHMGEASIADEHFCTSVTRTVVSRLRAAAPAPPPDGRRALCLAVAGDLHDLAIRMASDLLEMDGWTVECLGADVPTAEAVMAVEQAAEEPGRGFHLVAAGAATPLSLRSAIELVEGLRSSGAGRVMPVMVGGRCFSEDPTLAQAIGADGAARSLTGAVDEAARLVPRPPVRHP